MIKGVRNVLIKNVLIEVEIEIRRIRKGWYCGTKGLSGRNYLEENRGMLFIGNRDKKGHSQIWMRGMKFSIDIIWIAKGKIVHIAENAAPSTKKVIPTYGFIGYCDYELEVKAGFVKRHGIEIGDVFSGVNPDEF